MANDHTNANKKNLISSRKQHGLIRWQPPRGDFFKLNFDGSVQNSAAAAGFIIRNEHGEPVTAGARSLWETSINVAECLALRDALWIARSRGFWKVLVEGDSKLAIDAVQGTSGIPWRVMNIFEDIKIIARSFEYISWSHVFREANFVADTIADAGFQHANLHIWDRSLPSVACRALHFDCTGTGCTRGTSL